MTRRRLAAHVRALLLAVSFPALTILSVPLTAHENDSANAMAADTASAKSPATTPPTPRITEDSMPLDPRFSADRIRADVGFFADDLLLGRDTGSIGHEIATRYVAARFTALGLAPMGDETPHGRSYLQRITFQKTLITPGSASIAITGADGKTRSFLHGKDSMVATPARPGVVDVSAPMVFVGYGLVNKRFGMDDYKGLDVKGKIVVVLYGIARGLPSEEAAHLVMSTARTAAEHGAIGILGIASHDFLKVAPWDDEIKQADAPSFNWVETTGPDAGKAHDASHGLKLFGLLDDTAARAVLAGAPKTLEQIRALGDEPWVAGKPLPLEGFALKGTARGRATVTASRITSPDVAGMIPGSDPALRDQYVVLSGHIDHLGVSPAKPGEPADPLDPANKRDRIFNGAMDNGAGTSTLLEVAHVMAQDAKAGHGPRRSVIFLVSTGEEKGLLGADFFATHPPVPIGKIVGNVDLDMPILLYPFTDLIAFGATHSTMGSIVDKAGEGMHVKLSPDPMPEQALFVRSDHYMFVKQGVPAVFLATGYANGGEAQWNGFFKDRYHQVGDDMSQAFDWRAGARFAEANYRITSAMADATTPPLWYKDDFFGDLFAPNAARADK